MSQDSNERKNSHRRTGNDQFGELRQALYGLYVQFDKAILVLAGVGLGLSMLFLKDIEKCIPISLLCFLGASSMFFIIALSLVLFTFLIRTYPECMREDYLNEDSSNKEDRNFWTKHRGIRRYKIYSLLSFIVGVLFLLIFLFANLSVNATANHESAINKIYNELLSNIGQTIDNSVNKSETLIGLQDVPDRLSAVESHMAEIKGKFEDKDSVNKVTIREAIALLLLEEIRKIPSYLVQPLEDISLSEYISTIVNLNAFYNMLSGKDISVVAEEVRRLRDEFEELSREIYIAAKGGAREAVQEAIKQSILGKIEKIEDNTETVRMHVIGDPISPSEERIKMFIKQSILGKIEKIEDNTETVRMHVIGDPISPFEERIKMFIEEVFGCYHPPSDYLYSVYFNFDSSKLSPGAKEQINRLLKDQRPETVASIELEAYADTMGDTNYNSDVSRRRAEAVRYTLLESKLNQVPIYIISYGERRTPQPTKDGVAEPLNRVVKINVRSRE